MAYVALYRAYRPSSFEEVCGQEHIVKTLKNAIINNKLAHAYLFSGPRGTGKTSIAKIVAKAANCLNPNNGDPCNECEVCKGINKGTSTDVIELDAASNNGVDEIREICEKTKYLPTEGKYKVYIIDEVHMLSQSAFNALLKTLEEPPVHVIFILATTEVQKIPATILSRCQRFDFRAVETKEIIERIKYISEKEGFSIDEEAVEIIAEAAEGGMRDALSLLDEAVSYAGKNITADDVYQVSGSVNILNIIKLAQNILDKNSARVLQTLEDIVDLGKEIPKICVDMIGFYRDMLLFKNNPNQSKAIFKKPDFIQLAQKTSNQKIYFYLTVLNEAQNNMKFTNQKRTYLELALVKMSDYNEQIVLDNSDEIAKLSKKVLELEKQLKARPVMEPIVKKEEITASAEPIINNQEYKLITVKMVEDILNNSNKQKKNEMLSNWKGLSSKNEKTILSQLLKGNVIATTDKCAIITFDTASKCDFMMKKANRKKALEIINGNGKLIEDYIAIPSPISESIIADFATKFRAGNKKPTLDPIEIGIRTHEEDQVEEEKDEFEAVGTKLFGDLIEFE